MRLASNADGVLGRVSRLDALLEKEIIDVLVLTEVRLDLVRVQLEHHGEEHAELDEPCEFLRHHHFMFELQHFEQLDQLLDPHSPAVVEHELEAVEKLLLLGQRVPVALLDIDQHLLVAFALYEVHQVALVLLLPQVALDIEWTCLLIRLVFPNGFKLLLQQDLLVKLDFLDRALEAVDLLAVDDPDLVDGLGERLERPCTLARRPSCSCCSLC